MNGRLEPEQLLRVFGVPPELILPRPGRNGVAMFSNFDAGRNDDGEVVERLRQMAADCRSVLLCSPISGRGKSHLAAAYMARAFYHDVYPASERMSEQQIAKSQGNRTVWRSRGAIQPGEILKEVTPDGIKLITHPADAYRWINLDSFQSEHLGVAVTGVQSLERLEAQLDRILDGCYCLCLDELGREPPAATPRVMQIAREMLDRRRILIATSPLTAEALTERYRDFGHVFRRWIDGGAVIELSGGQTFKAEAQGELKAVAR